MQRRRKILIVDDSSLARRYCRHILETAGYEVSEAMNGLEALEELLMRPADMIIADINMPHMDGVTFVAQLRRQSPPLNAIPVLVTSSETSEDNLAQARAAGANLYRTKPLDEDTITRCAALLCGSPNG